jgi:hypothetical protein
MFGPTIELIDRRNDLVAEEVGESWPKVTYRGRDIIQLLLRADEALQPYVDAPAGIQECYLGYRPDTDTFVTGFDAWDEEGGYGAWIEWRLEGDSVVPLCHVNDTHLMGPGTFYHVGYRAVHEHFSGIIDLRLD